MAPAENDQPDSDVVLAHSVGPLRVLTLNRPEKLNASNHAMHKRILERLLEVEADTEARGLILTGAGRAFSAGGDRTIVKEATSGLIEADHPLRKIYWERMECLLRLPIPTIAAVNGPAVGFAAGLVALCDIVVMGEGAYFMDPHVTFDFPATSAIRLVWPHLTSNAKAKWALMSGERIYAEEAVRMGVATRVCPAGKELETALEMGGKLAALPPNGVAATKRAFNKVLLEELAVMRAEAQGSWR
jgi:enoyl-CoA hydratase